MMPDTAAPALFDGRVAAGQKAMLHGCLWALASLATAIAIYAAGFLVSDQKQREAGRMIVAAQKDTGYIATMVGGYAAVQGRHGRF